MSYTVEYVTGEDIPKRYRGWDDLEYQTVLKITYNDGSTNYYSDEYEPEDVSFHRDLSWIIEELEQAYEDGYKDGRKDGYESGILSTSGFADLP
jgi:hypothetical protein